MVNFEPWIGENYFGANRFGGKLLLLGESHYGEPSKSGDRELTKYVVKTYTTEKRLKYFTIISKMLFGRDASDEMTNQEMTGLWKDLAFYNYIQSFAGTGSRTRPTDQQWEDAKIPFGEVLQELKPDLVIVLGFDLEEHLLPFDPSISVCRVMHPSSSFSYESWNHVCETALQEMKTAETRN